MPGICYDTSALDVFFSRKSILTALGIPRVVFWEECSGTVGAVLAGDYFKNDAGRVAAVMKQGVRVLVYNGDKDAICNWMGEPHADVPLCLFLRFRKRKSK